jgi:hypothetical protein
VELAPLQGPCPCGRTIASLIPTVPRCIIDSNDPEEWERDFDRIWEPLRAQQKGVTTSGDSSRALYV